MERRRTRPRVFAGPAVVLVALLSGCTPSTSHWDAARPGDDPGATIDDAVDVTVAAAGALFDLALEGEPPVAREELHAWIRRNAERVAGYCGIFPVPDVHLTIISSGRGHVGSGYHQDGRRIRVRIGRRTDAHALEHDWVLVHEMLHTAFPDLPEANRWMQEGLSTYLEPILRSRDGELTEEDVWTRWVRMMPHGRPGLADRGLDRTHTWGRTYWGGALFWLVVDVELRERTHGERSLQDVVRAILAEGGNGRADWTPARVLKVGDDATGTTVMSEVYARMARAPGDVDLDRLWTRLGVARDGDGVELLDDAPLSDLRRAIVLGP